MNQEDYNRQVEQAYADRIPWTGYGAGFGNDNATVMEMRWESPEFIASLWRIFAGRVPMVIDGQAYLVRENPTIRAPMNDVGASRMIQVVRGFVNPVVSLSNISDDEAGLLFNYCMKGVVTAMILNQEEYEIANEAEMQLITSALYPILFAQIKRAVNGHESRQSKTQTQEIKQESMSTQRTSGGFSLNPFSKK